MYHESDRVRNPFGMDPPTLVDADPTTICGYGNPNADVHVIGDHPGVHGYDGAGTPFVNANGVGKFRQVLARVGLLESETAPPSVNDLFISYRHGRRTPNDRSPSPAEYAEYEPFFEAELRAVNAHILVPVGRRTIDYVLREYSTQRAKIEIKDVHACEIRGRGFLVVPSHDPVHWNGTEGVALESTLAALLASDYRQTKGVPTLVG